MSLREYKRKRHFNRTPEPEGKQARRGGYSFVVQKHHASRLHYDFRLELDGVLKSWAVPKGPSLDPAVKRLAMHVEDHPVDYGTFEGVIPEGEYGGGTVMLWDRGEWEPVGDPHEGYRTGKLKFKLHGEKLHGRWMLVRTGGGRAGDEHKQWLLFKERDDEAKKSAEGDVLDEDLSVQSGRSMDEIAADRDRVWHSNAKPKSNGRARKRIGANLAPKRRDPIAVADVPKAAKRKMPTRVEVQLATLAKDAPAGADWLHEIKLDGYRMICRIDNERVRFVTRNYKDWTERFTALVAAAKQLPAKQAVLDGEVVAMRADGTTDFQDLQNAFRDGQADELKYFVFDLLYLDGHDLTALPLDERKRLLAELLGGGVGPIRYSEHMEGSGPAFFKQACKMGLEGIICKRRTRPYQPGRGFDWLKVKCVQNAEFVIGGYSDPAGAREGFGALLVGYHNEDGALVYAGKVGTGFDDRTLHTLLERLKPLESSESPFSDRKRARENIHWVEPTLVAQIAFGSWTRDGLLRHPSFQGLREDKSAAEVTRDMARPLARTTTKKGKKQTKKKRASAATEAPAANGYDAAKQQFDGVRLTSPDKILYPEQGITKLDLANYYKEVAEWMLPHVAHRPLVLVRCPEGREHECFYQKHPPAGTPDTLRQIPIRESDKTEHYLVADDADGLISLAQIGALEIHVWGSREDKLELPDRLIFDLDPDPTVPWPRVVQSARQVRQFLEDLGLESFVKTTGGKGLHLVVPIDRRHDWDEAKAFCKQVAELIVAADPQHYTSNMSKAARRGKIFIDYLRNGRGATAIVAYSTRSRPNAPVSAPLSWEELSPRITSDRYTVRNMARRLASLKRDPWEGIGRVRQSLSGAIKAMKNLAR